MHRLNSPPKFWKYHAKVGASTAHLELRDHSRMRASAAHLELRDHSRMRSSAALGIERPQPDEGLCSPLGIERSQQDESVCGPLGIEKPQQDEGLCGPLGIERSQQDESLCSPLGIERSQQDKSLRGPPDMPTCFVGFGEHVVNLKNILLQDGVNVVGVTGMGGAGKSTLAAAICKDNEIRETSEITDDIMDGLCVSQHSLVRDFALYLAKQEDSRRLYISKMENHMLSEWEVLSSKAHIVSIHPGEMEDTQWTKMEFPEVEALVLYFTASEYCIPTFLCTMKNLKVLIIHNDDGARRCKLSGVAGFQELSQLKALHLESLIVSEECKLLKSLEKIYMGLCEGLGSNKAFNIPGLLEFNVSYCIDLEEIPAGLCSSVSLKRLLVAHCHRLAKLPDELDKLESLKEIKLRESPCLKTLPSSMCRLKKLKFLDISSCIHLKVNREVRCELKETLQKLTKLPSLKRVICDKNNEWLFKRSSRVDLKVEAVEEKEPNLDWLDWEGRKLVFG